jgi:hypothetical protein
MITNKILRITKKMDKLEKENEILKKRINELQYYDTSKLKQAKEQGRKDAIDEILKIIDKEKYSENDEWEETNEKLFQDAYNKALDDIKNKITKEMQE